MSLFALACQSAWAIQPEMLQTILEIANRENEIDLEALAAKRAARLDNAERAGIRNGVAVLPVVGPIIRRATLFSDISGATSLDSLSRDFNAALNNSSVQSILLDIDSPGGEVAGIDEFAQMIADSPKPVVAYVESLAASAGYWIASAAGEIVAAPTASLGCIGVVARVKNPDAKKAADLEFVSSQSPKKRPNLNTEAGRSQLQEHVDHMAEVFVSTVARNRGVSEEKVTSDFGQGGVLVGRRAVDAGLADKLGSFESTLSDLAMGKQPKRKPPQASAEAGSTTAEDESMNKTIESLKARVIAAFEGSDNAQADEKPAATAPTADSRANDEAIERLKADHLETQKKLVAERAARVNAEALSAYNTAFAAGKILPAEKEAFLADYRLAAADDEANPVEGVTRVGRLVERTEARTPHAMFSERVRDNGTTALSPKAEGSEGDVTPERTAELLKLTGLGQAALKAVK